MLRRRPRNIGAATGTATHKAVAVSLTHKITTGVLGNQTEADQAGLESLKKEIEHGVMWDAASPDLNTAEKQVVRQHHSYRNTVGKRIQPAAVEQRLEATHDATGFVLSGQQDVVITTDEAELRDLKTGTVCRANGPQYGGYAMLLRAHGTPLLSIIEDYVKRARIKDPQPDPVEIKYDLERSMTVAASILRRIKQDLDTFMATANPLAFLANPNSMLCSAKWCPAHGTEFCKEHAK